jgi:hypothetical protein
MSTLSINTIIPATLSAVSIPSLDKRMAKASLVYNISTQAVYYSYGISSITYLSTGRIKVTLATAMGTTSYVVVSVPQDNGDNTVPTCSPYNQLVGSFNIKCSYTYGTTAGTLYNPIVQLVVLGE